MNNNIKYTVGNPLLPGASICYGGVNFTIDTSGCRLEDILYLVLYKKGTFEEIDRILLDNEFFFGDVASVKVSIMPEDYDYAYISGNNFVMDKYAKIVNGMEEFGSGERKIITYGIYVDENISGNGKNKRRKKKNYIPFDETIIYKLHVRGFTKHRTSKVKHKGTFAGIAEKLDYLEELGINTIQLMPAYEFFDIMDLSFGGPLSADTEKKVNYWGYTDAYYFAPKSSYSHEKNSTGQSCSYEFKRMVEAIHNRNMEIIMEFYFVPGTNPWYICDCLRFWALEYGIDGFFLNDDVVPVNMIEGDSLLSELKIISGAVYSGHGYDGRYKRLAVCNDSFMITARKFIKGDEDCLYDMSDKLKRNPENTAVINYLSNHGTFSLMDTVSYDLKHNEANGENNNDGADYNYSWNCGVEGPTRKKKIADLRNRQIKNAFALLFTAQGVPLIYAGDEMGHTCKGNNNPYCQDNEISYLNYNNLVSHKDIFEFVKEMIKFRKEHKVLHMTNEARLMDFCSYGCPDMSFHGTEGWRMDTNHVYRHFAMMLCGRYAKNSQGEDDDNIYVAYNMHWENQKFGIPLIGKKSAWKVVYTTDISIQEGTLQTEGMRVITVPPRTVVILKEKHKDE